MESNALQTKLYAKENPLLKEFWTNYYGLLNENNLSFNLTGEDSINNNTHQIYQNAIPLSLSLSLSTFIKQSDKRLLFFMSAVWTIISHKLIAGDVVCFKTPNFDKLTNGQNKDIFFVHKVNGQDSFRQLLIAITDNYKSIVQHLDFPLSDIYKQLGNSSKGFEFNSFLSVESLSYNEPEFSFQKLGFDFFKDQFNQIHLKLTYDSASFNRSDVVALFDAFIKVTELVLNNIDLKIAEISLSSFEEQSKLINKFDISVDFPQKTICQIFDEVVQRFPNRQALVLGDNCITYSQLANRIDCFANFLQKKGVTKGAIVGILFEPSFHTIITILSILKSGGAYLPIDILYPENRILEIVADSSMAFFVSEKIVYETISSEGRNILEKKLEWIIFQEFQDILKEEVDHDLSNESSIHDLAYVLYTSGSTGKPKGVMIEHGNVVRLLFNNSLQFSFSENDVWTLFHRYCFDFSVWEMFGALLYGGKLVIIPTDQTRDPRLVAQIVSEQKVTVFNQTPTAFINFSNYILNVKKLKLHLRYVIFGGEVLKPHLLNEWYCNYPNMKLVNMYGITETTVHVTYKEIGLDDTKASVSIIGNPIPTVFGVVVDKVGQPVPINFPGELWVGGKGVARGYLNDVKLTNDKFIIKDNIAESKIYKSGDLVKINDNGELVYLGRIDNQVKVRGHRIEIGEIEKKVNEIAGLYSSLVVYNKLGNNELSCYYISEENISVSEIQSLLEQKLPAYMVPKYFLKVHSFPLTFNGKIDLDGLPQPTVLIKQIIPPKTQMEKQLLDIWKDILNVGDFGISQSFFELGGDSIKVLKLIYRINEHFNQSLDLNILYNNPTIESIASVLIKTSAPDNKVAEDKIKDELTALKATVISANNELASLVEDIYPMTDVQLGMVFHNLQSKDIQSIYSDQKVHYLSIRDFDNATFENALKILVQYYEVLRTGFNLNDHSVPIQLLYKEIRINYHHFDLTKQGKSQKIELIKTEIEKNRRLNFQLSSPGLFRVKTFLFEKNKIILLIHLHHAIMDGWSYAVFLKKLWTSYNHIKSNNGPLLFLPELSFRQKDYVIKELLLKRRTITQDFWKLELNDITGMTSFPQKINSLPLKYEQRELYKDINSYKKIKSLSDQLGLSVKSVYFGAYLYLIYRLSNDPNLLVGLTTTTRPIGEDIADTVGCFLNIVPVKFVVENHVSAHDFLTNVHKKLMWLSGHDKLPLFEIRKLLTSKNAQSLNLNNYFTFNDFAIINDERHELTSKTELKMLDRIRALGSEHSDVPFQITVNKGENRVRYIIQLSNNYIDEFLIDKVGEYYDSVIDQLICNGELPLGQLELLKPLEKEVLLSDFNDTNFETGEFKHLVNYFNEKLILHPNAVAVVFGKTTLTYSDLNIKANALVGQLSKHGINRDQVIGVKLDRSLELMVTLIAILKIGAIYLPIVPNLPAERVAYMLENSNCKLVVTHSGLGVNQCQNVYVDNIPDDAESTESDFPQFSSNLAYVIYTSGTSGKPKGVAVEHKALMNRLNWMIRHYQITDSDVLVHKTSIAFDVSLWELLIWMMTGSKLIILEQGKEVDPDALIQVLNENKISIMHFVPSMLKSFLSKIDDKINFNYLRLIVSSGEVLDAGLVNDFYERLPRVVLANLYGPTEAAIDVTYYDCKRINNFEKIPIGKPIDNIKLLILNRELQIQPIGFLGELYISGTGLARGYINNFNLTRERFFSSKYFGNATIYKTGDLARWLPDGNIEFLGRNDSQLKIRGHRIETEEIIYYAKKYHPIVDAIVNLTLEKEVDERKLCLYYISKEKIDVTKFKAFLGEYLPSYMIPSYIMRIEKLPITLNGKLDLGSLPAPVASFRKAKNVKIITEVESKLAAIWSEVLDLSIKEITVINNFFEMGGHSLKILKIQNDIKKVFDVNVSIEELLKNSTIRGHANLINKYILAKNEQPSLPIEIADVKAYYKTSHQQKSLFFIQYTNPDSIAYNIPLLIKLKNGNSKVEKVIRVINQLINRHSIMRTIYEIFEGEVVQKVDPYHSFVPEKIILNDTGRLEHQFMKLVCPFNLVNEPVYKVKIISIGEERYILFDIHHIAVDGISMDILIKDFYYLYNGLSLPEIKFTYPDYCEWINNERVQTLLQKQESFWLNEFNELDLKDATLPYDWPNKRTTSFSGACVEYSFDKNLSKKMLKTASEQGCTPFMLSLAIYNILLFSMSGHKNNIVGCPVSGRTYSELEGIVGMFTNTIALPFAVDPTKGFDIFLTEVKTKLLKAYDNQDYPFEQLVEKVKAVREYGRNPLFDSYLVFKNKSSNSKISANSECEILPLKSKTSKFDLCIIITQDEGQIELLWEYNTTLFKEATIHYLASSFKSLLSQICESPQIIISELFLESQGQTYAI